MVRGQRCWVGGRGRPSRMQSPWQAAGRGASVSWPMGLEIASVVGDRLGPHYASVVAARRPAAAAEAKDDRPEGVSVDADGSLRYLWPGVAVPPWRHWWLPQMEPVDVMPPEGSAPHKRGRPTLERCAVVGDQAEVDVVHRGGLARGRNVVRPDFISDHAPALGVGDPLPAVLAVDPHLLARYPSSPVTGLQVEGDRAGRPLQHHMHDRLRLDRCQAGPGPRREFKAAAAAPTAATSTSSTTKRRRRVRRLASAISRWRENGNLGTSASTDAIIASTRASVKPARSGSFRNTGPRSESSCGCAAARTVRGCA